jgi:putative ABC transport system permease protein
LLPALRAETDEKPLAKPHPMESLLHDLRSGLRVLRRKPAFTVIAVVTLALGIGVNTAMMSVVSALLFRDLPYRDVDRLMVLWRDTESHGRSTFSIPTLRDVAERNRSFERLATFRFSSKNLLGREEAPERLPCIMASAEFPRVLGIEPQLGRSFLPEDDRLGAARTAIISHELWERRFGGDESVLGTALELDGLDYTVIGVLPPGLSEERLDGGRLGDLWLPLGLFLDQLPAEKRDERMMQAVGRLGPGVSADAARRDLDRIFAELHAEHPSSYENNRFTGALLRRDLHREIRVPLISLQGAVCVVLLIACVNLVHLLLTHLSQRQRELATRMALGASRGRLIRQLVTESLLLGLFGGALGIAGAYFYLPWVEKVLTGDFAIRGARLDATVCAASVLLTLTVSLVCGLVPAFRATRGRRQRDLTGGGLAARGGVPHRRFRRNLVAVEIALALVVLIVTGLMLRTVDRLSQLDPGFRTERLLTLKIQLPQWQYEQPQLWRAFFEQALERLRALPEVETAAVTTLRPLEGDPGGTIVAAGDRPLPETPNMANGVYQLVSPGFFHTLDIPLLAGRDFDSRDDDRHDSEPVVVISESLARRLWPGESPIDKIFAFEFTGSAENPIPQWRRIIGVVGDVRLGELHRPSRFAVYAPYTQHSLYFDEESPAVTLMVRARGEPDAVAGKVRDTLSELDRRQPVHSLFPMEALIEAALEEPRMISSLLSFFAVLALALALVGVYGLVSLLVASRTREIATRIAFGATPSRIFFAVLREGASLVAVGLGSGLVVTAVLMHWAEALFYDAAPIDPSLYLTVALLLGATVMISTLSPAWRATRVAPAQALRYE